MEIRFDVGGIDGVSERLLQRALAIPVRAAAALNFVAEETMTDAKIHTPVKFGTLKRSGHVQHATARSLAARLVFGTEYAVWVHERTELRHKNGEAKFLEHAVQRTAHGFEERIAFGLTLR